MMAGQGVVLDSGTLIPIEGTLVVLECMRGVFPHGSELVDKFRVTTDDRGRYFFSSIKLGFCDYGFVTPYKDGYVSTASVDTRYRYTSYEKIPEKLHLTPVSDAVMQRLRYLAVTLASRFRDARTAYESIFAQFVTSKAIAKMPREIAFVKDSFCVHLESLNEQLSPDERTDLHRFQAGFPPQLVDHAKVVQPYCSEP